MCRLTAPHAHSGATHATMLMFDPLLLQLLAVFVHHSDTGVKSMTDCRQRLHAATSPTSRVDDGGGVDGRPPGELLAVVDDA